MNIPLSLYIHIPWCVRKCPYCDFNSHTSTSNQTEREQHYVAALLGDLGQESALVSGRPIQSIFFGGGTPSLFSGAAIAAILEGVKQRVELADNAEITLEANPGTLEAGRFVEFKAAGVNRLSIGVQSFHDAHLQRLGRIHDQQAALQAVAAARAAGFNNFNIDLMFALPEQSIEQALADVEQAIRLDAPHISHYQLTLEPGTAFYRNPPVLPDDDAAWAIQQVCHERLSAAGYEQYEVSAWALPGRQCRHNLNYWQFGDYLGIGAGAHGKISSTTAEQMNSQVLRRAKRRSPQAYMNDTTAYLDEAHQVSGEPLAFEYLLNALRLRQGFQWVDFEQRTGLKRNLLAEPIMMLAQKGLLVEEQQGLRTTEQGWLHLNAVIETFLPEAA